jgi:phenylpyruvate tautomerase PptA (4-oxalocrotonate tautomerase family)
MCNVHFERAVLKTIKKKDKREIANKLTDAIEDEIKLNEEWITGKKYLSMEEE